MMGNPKMLGLLVYIYV